MSTHKPHGFFASFLRFFALSFFLRDAERFFLTQSQISHSVSNNDGGNVNKRGTGSKAASK